MRRKKSREWKRQLSFLLWNTSCSKMSLQNEGNSNDARTKYTEHVTTFKDNDSDVFVHPVCQEVRSETETFILNVATDCSRPTRAKCICKTSLSMHLIWFLYNICSSKSKRDSCVYDSIQFTLGARLRPGKDHGLGSILKEWVLTWSTTLIWLCGVFQLIGLVLPKGHYLSVCLCCAAGLTSAF